MFIDALCLVSDAQAFTVDANSTYSIDLGNVTPKREIGTGEPLVAALAFDVAASGGGIYEFQVIQSATSDLATPDILCTIRLLEGQMTTTCLAYVPIPPGLVTKRYIGVYFNNVSGTTAVTVSAVIGPWSFVQSWRSYAKGYSIQ